MKWTIIWLLVIAFVIVTLTACASYTNDKGQECNVSLDPIAIAVTGQATYCKGGKQ
jgi:hypothetical protein